jgi:hypothetical protein
MAWLNNTKRSDGLYVFKSADTWAIRYKGNVIEVCPCCDRSMLSARSARLVADAYYPLPNGEPPPEAA